MSDRPFAGRSILVVEDESLVLFNLEDILGELGCSIVGPAMRMREAERLAAGPERIDAAILDVNIGGAAIYPVAELLAARGVPIVFATGYGRSGIEAAWRERPVLLKPYTAGEVEAALADVLAQPAALPA